MAGLGSALQSADGGLGAAAEFFDLHTHALGERDEEVAEGSVVVRVMGYVGAVLKAATRHDDGQVLGVVGGGVAQVRAEEDGGVIQQVLSVFLHSLQLGEKFAEELELGFLDDLWEGVQGDWRREFQKLILSC